MRRSTIIWFLIATCIGVALFLLKYEVQNKEDRLAELHRGILADQEAIHVLEAEWSYLNRPDRLEAQVRKYLNLVPLDQRRVDSLDVLPMRMPRFDALDTLPTEEELISAGLPPIPALRPFLGSGVVRASTSQPEAVSHGPLRQGNVRQGNLRQGNLRQVAKPSGPVVLTSGGVAQ